jgi:hypothetical protein
MLQTGVTDQSLLTIAHTCAGRALYVCPDGALYVARGCAVYRSDDDGRTWKPVVRLPYGPMRRLVKVSRLACRVLRHEIRAWLVSADGSYVASDRREVYYARPGEPLMSRSRIDEGGVRPMAPISLSAGPNNRILWGEYGANKRRRSVRIYVSDDGGHSFSVAYVFDAGSIRHVHNIVYDRDLEHYWVLAGDHGHEPGIGRLSADLNHFEWVVKGEQRYRAVCVFDFGDRLVYGTDTEMEPNAVLRLDKNTGRIERVTEMDGSCIYACRFGGLYVMSTTVEPSKVNRSQNASLWVSRDGERWTKVFQAAKDRWNERYFQFGSLVLPRGESDREAIAFSGQAVRGLDGSVVVATLRAPGR